MPLTVTQLQQLEPRQLIDMVNFDADEFTTSNTERALAYQLEELLDINDGLICMGDVEGTLSDIEAQFPSEDFLGHALDICDDIVSGKMRKADIIDEVQRLRHMLADIQDDQANATVYALTEMRGITDPNPYE